MFLTINRIVAHWNPPVQSLLLWHNNNVGASSAVRYSNVSQLCLFIIWLNDSTSRHTGGHCKKLCRSICLFDVQFYFYCWHVYWHRVINIWNALPDTVDTAPSAASFKKRFIHVEIIKYSVIFWSFVLDSYSGYIPALFVLFGAVFLRYCVYIMFPVTDKSKLLNYCVLCGVCDSLGVHGLPSLAVLQVCRCHTQRATAVSW